MATKEIANNVGNNISEFGQSTGRRASRGGQRFLDRMLRATGGGASNAGESTESALNHMADSLPINKERIRTRNTRLALGAISLAAIATGIRYREQIMNRFRSGAPEEQPAPLAEAPTTTTGTTTATTGQTPVEQAPAPYPIPAAEEQRTRTTAGGRMEGSPS